MDGFSLYHVSNINYFTINQKLLITTKLFRIFRVGKQITPAYTVAKNSLQFHISSMTGTDPCLFSIYSKAMYDIYCAFINCGNITVPNLKV